MTGVQTCALPICTGAKNIKEYGTTAGNIKNRWNAGGCGIFTYDGTNWLLVAAQQDDNTTYSVATTSANGLMSKEDKAKLDNVGPGYTYGTTDLEAGVSPLASGQVYFVYE